MYICAEYLKMTHMEYKKLPLEERLKWLIYTEEEGKQRKKEMDERDDKVKFQKLQAEAKKAQNPGVSQKPKKRKK